jgi:hypothetical protein
MNAALMACVVVPLLLVCWSSNGRLRHSPWPACAVILIYGSHFARIAVANVRRPYEWDYGCFWLFGHIAAARQNVYDPAVFAHFPTPFKASETFHAIVWNVGFPYPPPTMALFLPLGFIDNMSIGLALWYGAQFAALGAAAWILARTFMPAAGWRSALLVLAVIVALPTSLMNVAEAQMQFLLLLIVALALRDRGTAAGAVWEMLAVWVKPYTAVLLLLDLVRAQWRRLLVACATAFASLVAGVFLVGPAAFASYFRTNPATREPSFTFVEVYNQSLLANVLRLHAVLPQPVSIAHEPLYLATALIFALLTIVLCVRAPRKSEVAFASMLLLGLIVYPLTWTAYGVMIIIPLLVLWRERDSLPGRAATAATVIGAAVLLQSDWLQRGFEANVLMWFACGYLLLVARGNVFSLRFAPRAPGAGSTAVGVVR